MTVISAAAPDVRRLLLAQKAIADELATAPAPPGRLERLLALVCEASVWPAGTLWLLDRSTGALVPGAICGADGGAAISGVARGSGVPGIAWATAAPATGSVAGTAAVAVPLGRDRSFVGVLELRCTDDREADAELLTWLEVVAAQVAQHLETERMAKALAGRDRALTHAVNGVVIADATVRGFPIVYANPGFERLTGWRADEIEGRPCSVLQHPEADPAAIAAMRTALAAGREAHVTVLNARKDGTRFWNEVFLSPVFEDGRLVEYVGVQNDVTERHAAETQAEFLAYHDSLTGLGNRALLGRVLERVASRVERHGVQAALAYLDLDNFKQLNDARGHAVGDQVLRVVADRLRGVVRPNDLLVRQGGDEFLMLMPDLEPATAVGDALAAAELLRLAVAEPFVLGGEEIRLRVSVGVSVLGRDAHDPDEAMRHADTAMYRAKRVSRGDVRLYRETGAARQPGSAGSQPPPSDDARVRAAALDGLLETASVVSVYQPIVDLDTGEVVAYEALARGPVDSVLAQPDDLFRTARETGRVGELDWACRGAALRGALEAGFERPRRLFVNVEADALALPCPRELEELWGRGGEQLDVVVEITERSLTARPADLLHLVREVRERGWGIALDDVGADVRALAIMPLLRPDVIKLDLRLVQDSPTTEIAEIVQAVNAECERTGALVLAEGIETEAHLAIARSLGATLGQGWYFGRPGALPAQHDDPPSRPIVVTPVDATGSEVSPFAVVARVRDARRGDKQLLFAISLQLEQQAAALGESALIVSAFQHADRFTPRTAERYTLLGVDTAFVAALGVGMPAEPAPNVRGADLPAGDPLRGEWSVVVLGPHFAAALVAVEVPGDGPDAEPGFDFAVTYERELVVEAASALMRRIQPLPG